MHELKFDISTKQEVFLKIEKYLNLESGWSFVVDLSNGYEDIWFDEKKLVK